MTKKLFRHFTFKHIRRPKNGYILPAVIILGMAISVVSITSLQSVSQNSLTLNNQFYRTVAREAGQAGIAAVKTCVLSQPGTWLDGTNPGDATQISSANPLTPQTTCSQTIDSARSETVADNSTYSSTYTVTKVARYPGATTSIEVTSIGKVHIKGPSGTISMTISEPVRAFARSVTASTGPTSKRVADISTGESSACALTAAPDNWVYCWGENSDAQLGSGQNVENNVRNLPISVSKNATPLAAVGSSRGDGRACGGFLQPACTIASTPAQPASAMRGKIVKKVSVGTTHTCAVATESNGSNGRAYCWGSNSHGQLGVRNQTVSGGKSFVPMAVDTANADYTPPPVTPSPCGGWFQPSCTPVAQPLQPKSGLGGVDVIDITAGDKFTCALTSTQKVACWGLNGDGQLGDDSRTDRNYPVAVSEATYVPPVTQSVCVEYGWFGACNRYGTEEVEPAKPASAMIGVSVKKLAKLQSGARTMCVITVNDDAICWGKSDVGQTGNGKSISAGSVRKTASKRHTNPNKCDDLRRNVYDDVRSAAGPAHIDSDELRPVRVSGTTKYDAIIVNNASSSGDGDEISTAGTSTSPTYRSGSSRAYVTAKSTSGYLYYWGGSREFDSKIDCYRNGDTYGGDHSRADAHIERNYTGATTPQRLYNGTAGPSNPLNQVSVHLMSGNAQNGLFCATHATLGTLYCDGHGDTGRDGQLGNNRTYTCSYFLCIPPSLPTTPQAVYTSPTAPQPAWLSGVALSAMDTGNNFTCVTGTDYKAYCWGANDRRQLGDGTSDSYKNIPTPVNYTDTNSGLHDTAGGSSGATWENQIWF
jgi:alpha-tubulin suppressor-like RCC1 family protein